MNMPNLASLNHAPRCARGDESFDRERGALQPQQTNATTASPIRIRFVFFIQSRSNCLHPARRPDRIQSGAAHFNPSRPGESIAKMLAAIHASQPQTDLPATRKGKAVGQGNLGGKGIVLSDRIPLPPHSLAKTPSQFPAARKLGPSIQVFGTLIRANCTLIKVNVSRRNLVPCPGSFLIFLLLAKTKRLGKGILGAKECQVRSHSLAQPSIANLSLVGSFHPST